MNIKKLAAKTVANAREGKHPDGGGLRLEVKGGSKRWVFRYRFAGKDGEIGIGTYPAMSLADARAKRSQLHDLVDAGTDPRGPASTPSQIVTLAALCGRPAGGNRYFHFHGKFCLPAFCASPDQTAVVERSVVNIRCV
jgi:hypothetical protein